MANKNDKTIFKLKEQIEAKKQALAETKKFTPVTNCSLVLNTARINLHTLDVVTAQEVLIALNMHRISAEDLGLLDEYKMCGYTITDWIADVKAKLMNINRKMEEDKLKAMEAKLHGLLSLDSKVELELDQIAKSLEV